MASIELYEVEISERAQNNVKKILKYLDVKWSQKVKEAFLIKFKKSISLLETNPYLFQEFSKRKKIRKCLISKHNALYFKIIKNKVQIITIHDTRRNPSKIAL
jgi:plasmid stabilization system protein ParE